MKGTVTRRRRLRSGRTLWQAIPEPALPTTSLRKDIKCDVVIVGAGISGAMIAERLSEDGFAVAVLDRREPIAGSTMASTALLQYELDTPLSTLARRIGKGRSERMWRRSKLALDALGERLQGLGLSPCCARRSSLYLEGDLLDPGALRDEAMARRQAGFESTYLSRARVEATYGIRHRAALLGHGSLEANPRRLASGFLRAALSRKTRLYAKADVTMVEPGADGVTIGTRHGPSVSARHAIFATGYEMLRGIPTKGHRITSTWALATRPQPRATWTDNVLISEASAPYLYLRVGPGGRILCGGEDESDLDDDARDALTPTKIEQIEVKLQRLLPGIDPRADYAWSGNFGASPTGSPSIGAVPGMRNCYAVLGYGGNGITFSMMAAQLLSTILAGRNDPDADLFSFRRRF
jgi:glycine/D-amino acid oxidase-like deaminating enzyme